MRNIRWVKLWKRKAVCWGVLCGLILGGCGQAELSREAVRSIEMPTFERRAWEASGRTSGETEDPDEDLDRATGEPGLTSGEEQPETTEEILARLLSDQGFRNRASYYAEIEEGDTEKIILQKLEQCEYLELREPPYGKGVASLEDLALMPNLKALYIEVTRYDDAMIEDFSPIAGLSRLEELYISYDVDREADLSFLSDRKTIKQLFLPYCHLKSIDFLEDMPQLERLSLYETPVDDLSVLEKLPELVELSVGGNTGACHIEAIGTLAKLENLGLQDCGIENIDFLSELKELRGLNLNDNAVKDLTPLSGLVKLERLGLSRNGLEDISSISGLCNLYDLALDGNEIEDISALAGLAHLNQAGLSDNRITDLSPLADKEELMYAAVFGNPCRDLRPVMDVPMLYFSGQEFTEKEAAFAAKWMEENRSETKNLHCLDCETGDLNLDGRTDYAFVAEEKVAEGDDGSWYGGARELVVLLQQKDGSFQELSGMPYISESTMGGMRGDPYRGLFMGEGILMLKTGWGSSSGATETEIYSCRDGALWPEESIAVVDYAYAAGYDVTVRKGEGAAECRYAIAMDGYRMVRVDLETLEHPAHKAFPEISIFDMDYYIYRDKTDTRLSVEEALDLFRDSVWTEAIREELPYEPWQKENYELLMGIELPDYYYVYYYVIEGEPDYFYYQGRTYRDGVFYHLVCDVRGGDSTLYYINDGTGEITEAK